MTEKKEKKIIKYLDKKLTIAPSIQFIQTELKEILKKIEATLEEKNENNNP